MISKKKRLAAVAAVAVLAVTVGAIFFLTTARGPRIAFFDVGQGDAALVIDGADQALIDGGPDRSVMAKLGRNMPFFDRRIETVFLTHPHSDHITGLIAALGRYRTDRLVLSSACPDTALGERLLRAAAASGAEVVVASAGDRFVLGGSVTAVVIWPPVEGLPSGIAARRDINDCSLVIRLDFGGPSALMMGDAGREVEGALVRSGAPLDADVLKAGHHGSGNSSSADFIAAANPEVAVISVGRNSYGHPSPALIRRLESAGVRVWRTDRDGDFDFKARGANTNR
jgi:competence protein ComEC